MFKNLQAEQARLNLTNNEVAERLGISRVSYENKKKSVKFYVAEISKLCEIFGCSYEYLFATDAA